MFTGLVQSLATVKAIVPEGPGVRLEISDSMIAVRSAVGDSIALWTIGGDTLDLARASPRGHDVICQLAAALHQERARAQSGVADLQLKQLISRGLFAQAANQRLQRLANDRLGQRAPRKSADFLG